MKQDWDYFKNKLTNSPNNIQIYKKPTTLYNAKKLKSVLDIITNSVSLIQVNQYLRILGTSKAPYENIISFTKEFQELFGEEKYIIAHDAFGGLFATEKTVQYFAPDTLQWEDMQINYEGFINWISSTNIDNFYKSFLWNDTDSLIAKVNPDEGIFIYPFLWAKECDIFTAFKKIVPYKDILINNLQNKELLL